MKVSLNWIRDINKRYACSAEPAPEGVDKLVEKIGAQLGQVDEVINIGQKYEGVLVVKVISVEKHPDADKLTVCAVDDGGAVQGVKRDKNGHVQIVCGAPNVAPTLLVAWIPPGVVVPSTYDKDPFVLETRQIRGMASNGMLASSKELAFGDNHEGLLVIDENVKPGTPFAKIYGLDDYIIDIENKMFTHRPDLFGMLGVARELAGIQGHVFKSPDWYVHNAKPPKGNSRDTHPLKIKNEVPKLVPRFVAIVMKDVKVEPSPLWLQARLLSVGVRPINNIVDLTNFFMWETAQPLHAYDYDKVAGLAGSKATLGVRLSKSGEELTLLGGKKIKLKAQEIVITDGQRPIGLGGVMGGADTEVDEDTKAIILECATFDMYSIRRTAMAYGLFSDAAIRFTKGQSPLQNVAVAAKAADEISRVAGGRVTSAHDDNHLTAELARRGSLYPAVKTTAGFVNSRLGLDLNASGIKKLLGNVEFKFEKSGDKFEAAAPFWRTDIEIPEDIVEETGRLYGYDHLPQELPTRDLTPVQSSPELELKSRLRATLSKAGGNEVLTYSFVDDWMLKKVGQSGDSAYALRNALSPELKYYRLSLTPSLLDKVQPNLRLGYEQFMLYELGKTHIRGVKEGSGLPQEQERLSLVVAASSKNKFGGAAYYDAKYLVDFLMEQLGINNVVIKPLAQAKDLQPRWQPAAAAYEPLRSGLFTKENEIIGLVGEPKTDTKAAMKLPARISQAELDLSALLRLQSPTRPYRPISRYPGLEQDICLRTSVDISYSETTALIVDFLDGVSKKHGYEYDVSPLDIFQRPKEHRHKQTTWRIKLRHTERTLTTKESNSLLDELAQKAKAELNAERI